MPSSIAIIDYANRSCWLKLQTLIKKGALDKPDGSNLNYPSAKARLAQGCTMLAQQSALSPPQVHVWEAIIHEHFGAPESASVSFDCASRSTAVTCDILDASELAFTLEGAFTSVNLPQTAKCIVIDPAYGLFPEDTYDQPPDPERLKQLIEFLVKEVCLTCLTLFYGIHEFVLCMSM
jgi:hypothetical protein